MERFSKKALAQYIESRLQFLPYDPDNGTAQVEGKRESFILEYGEFRELLDLASYFDLFNGYIDYYKIKDRFRQLTHPHPSANKGG